MNTSIVNKLNKTLANFVAQHTPVVDAGDNELFFAEHLLTERDKQLWHSCGFGTSFEVFYKVLKLCKYVGIYTTAPNEYLLLLIKNAKKLSANAFLQDKYISNLRIPTVKKGNLLLTTACYEKNEFFQYAMPDYNAPTVVPKLGFFDNNITFPTLYEDNIPWVSVIPSEVSSMQQGVKNAYGNVLVLGLGLGWYAYQVSEKPNVTSVTVVELSADVISLFCDNVLPQFTQKQKVKVVQSDAVAFLQNVKNGEYDYCYADIWENQFDGAEWYKKIKPFETALPSVQFDYWIEQEILWFISQEKHY